MTVPVFMHVSMHVSMHISMHISMHTITEYEDTYRQTSFVSPNADMCIGMSRDVSAGMRMATRMVTCTDTRTGRLFLAAHSPVATVYS